MVNPTSSGNLLQFKPKYTGIPVLNIGQFLNLKFDSQVTDLIHDAVLPWQGRFVLLGLKGTGKTLLVTQMAAELAGAHPFLGTFNINNRYRVLVLQKELPDNMYQDRLEAVMKRYTGIRTTDIIIPKLENIMALRLDTAKGIELLEETIDHVQPNVVIIDPLYKFHFVDENLNYAMKPMIEALDILRVKYGVSFVISHHTRKPGTDPRTGKRFAQDMFATRGSSLVIDWADTVFTMNGDKNNHVLIDTFMRAGVDEPPSLALKLNRKYATFDGGIQGALTGKEDWDIVDVLTKHNDEMSYDDLTYELINKRKLGKRTAPQAIHAMEAKRMVYYIGYGSSRRVRLLSVQTRNWAF